MGNTTMFGTPKSDVMSQFDEVYRGTPPWDIGRAQKEFIMLEERGEIRGSILDVGCGTGENSLFFAGLGHRVVGVDFSSTAIKKALEKGRARKIENAEFRVLDALQLSELKEKPFDNAIDCGLFHVFGDETRAIYVKGLYNTLHRGGKYFMLCFSEFEPREWGGPRRITQNEIRDSFADGWKVDYIKDARLESHLHDGGGRAWLSSVTRL